MTGATVEAGFNDVVCSVTFSVNQTIAEDSVLVDIVDEGGILADPSGDELDCDFVGNYYYFSGDAPAPVISALPNPIVFSPVNLGEPVNRTLTITNIGNADLEITAVNFGNELYTSDFTSAITLAADGTIDLTVTYATPADNFGIGTNNSTLTLENNSSDANYSVNLEVAAIRELTVEPTVIDFGEIDDTLYVAHSFTVTNTGTELVEMRVTSDAQYVDVPLVVLEFRSTEGININLEAYRDIAVGQTMEVEVYTVNDPIPGDYSGDNTGQIAVVMQYAGGAEETQGIVNCPIIVNEVVIEGFEIIESAMPNEFGLSQNYPNPFNPTTTIIFDVAKFGAVELSVFDLSGKQVAVLTDSEMLPGTYAVNWDGSDMNGKSVAAGVYFYRMITDGFIQTNKMIYLK